MLKAKEIYKYFLDAEELKDLSGSPGKSNQTKRIDRGKLKLVLSYKIEHKCGEGECGGDGKNIPKRKK